MKKFCGAQIVLNKLLHYFHLFVHRNYEQRYFSIHDQVNACKFIVFMSQKYAFRVSQQSANNRTTSLLEDK